eukprot:11264164-Heterocapsa_arctica.AAC.1
METDERRLRFRGRGAREDQHQQQLDAQEAHFGLFAQRQTWGKGVDWLEGDAQEDAYMGPLL